MWKGLPRASLRLPTNRGGLGADDPANATSRPSWVLLDSSAFVLDRRNYTTATCKFMGDKELQVTFFVAHPPNVSYFCVYCPDLKPTAYDTEPRIVATDADLVLLRIVLHSQISQEYCIYRAAGEEEPPTLEWLPPPCPFVLCGHPLGLFRHDTGFIIVTLGDDSSRGYRRASRCRFEVCLFDSRDKVWTTKPVDLPQRIINDDRFYHVTSKVILLGGERGTVAFVDLWRGILLYDALAKAKAKASFLMRYIPLPQSTCGNEEYNVDPLLLRDIAIINGNFKFVEMGFVVRTTTGGWNKKGPMVATYSMPVTRLQENTWHHDCTIDVSNIRDDKNILSPELPLMLTDDERMMELEPTMQTLFTGHPTLCLHDEDTVYFMTKVLPSSAKACVIAVSMTEGNIQAGARFGAERTYRANITFTKSRISSYLKMPPDTEAAGLKKKKKKTKGKKKGAGCKPEMKDANAAVSCNKTSGMP